MRELLIIRGLPGSGKTRISRDVCARTGAVLIEEEMFWNGRFSTRLIRQSREWMLAETTRQLWSTGRVCVSGTFVLMSEIVPYLHMCRYLGVRCSFAQCQLIDQPTQHEVPPAVLATMKNRWMELDLKGWDDVVLNTD